MDDAQTRLAAIGNVVIGLIQQRADRMGLGVRATLMLHFDGGGTATISQATTDEVLLAAQKIATDGYHTYVDTTGVAHG